jgi:CBS-domain-containing membrane protein
MPRPHHACPVQRRRHIAALFTFAGLLIGAANVLIVSAVAHRDRLEVAAIVGPMTAAACLVAGFAVWASDRS